MLDGILMNWSCDSHGERSPHEKDDKVCSEGSEPGVSLFKEEVLDRWREWVSHHTLPFLDDLSKR